jgi:hypothetical protein
MSYFEKVISWLHDGVGKPILLNSRDHLEVEIASQITPPFVAHFYELNNGWTTTTQEGVVDSQTITVADATSAIVGQSIIISDVVNARFYIGHVIAINGLIITLDSDIDYPYSNGSDCAFASHDMNVNGLVTHRIFGLRLAEPPASLQEEITLDITRVLHTMITDSLGDLADFGDIEGGLEFGMVLRKKYTDGTFGNILNVKTNGDFALYAYDYDRYIAANPGIGVNGQKWRLTFGGEEKMGTVIRIAAGEDLQWVIQDDLSTLLDFTNVAEGALVAD